MLAESAVGFLRTRPLQCYNYFTGFHQSKPYLKERLAKIIPIDVENYLTTKLLSH